MLAETEQLIPFVQVGPTRRENNVVRFGDAQSAHFWGWVELGGPLYNFPADIMINVLVFEVNVYLDPK